MAVDLGNPTRKTHGCSLITALYATSDIVLDNFMRHPVTLLARAEVYKDKRLSQYIHRRRRQS